MPKYDYRCGAGHQYEKREGFDAPSLQDCQVCGEPARRVLTPPAIVFKGSGWYKTDSRSSGSTASSGNADGGAEGSAEAKDGKAETKSEPPAKSDAPAKAESAPAPAASSAPSSPATG